MIMLTVRISLVLLFLILDSGICSFAQTRFNATLSGFKSEKTKRIIGLEDGGYIIKELESDWNAKNCYIVITRFNACSQEIWSKKIEPSGMPLPDPAVDSM